MFLRTDDNIIDSVFREQGRSVRRARINLPYLLLSRAKVETMRPDVPGISHDRSSAGQIDRGIVNRSVQNCHGCMCQLLNRFSKRNAIAIELLVFTLADQKRKDIQSTSQSQDHEKARGDNSLADVLSPQARQQQRDNWRRYNPPVEKHLDVVPNPRRQLHEIR